MSGIVTSPVGMTDVCVRAPAPGVAPSVLTFDLTTVLLQEPYAGQGAASKGIYFEFDVEDTEDTLYTLAQSGLVDITINSDALPQTLLSPPRWYFEQVDDPFQNIYHYHSMRWSGHAGNYFSGWAESVYKDPPLGYGPLPLPSRFTVRADGETVLDFDIDSDDSGTTFTVAVYAGTITSALGNVTIQ